MKNTTKGIIWIVAPIVGLVLILSAYAITSFVVNTLTDVQIQNQEEEITEIDTIDDSQVDVFGIEAVNEDVKLGEYDTSTTLLSIINVALGFLGVIAVIMILVGIGFGIFYFTKGDGLDIKNHLPHLGKDYAGFWIRVASYIIDAIIINIGSFVLGLILGIIMGLFSLNDELIAGIAGTLIMIIGTWLYFVLFESSKIQATPGKLALSIKVVDVHGKRISFGRATGRYFAKILSAIILYIGFFMIGWTKKKQGLHDMIAKTYVIKD